MAIHPTQPGQTPRSGARRVGDAEPSKTKRSVGKPASETQGVAPDSVELSAAAHGQQALERCDGATDVLVTAWDLPGISGIDLVRRLRSNPDTGGVRVLMVTSRNAREDVLEALDAGVDGYLLKPLEPETLRRKIDRALAPEESIPGGSGAF